MYTIGPLSLIKGEGQWPEYHGVLKDLQEKAVERAQSIWTGYSFGGLYPGDKQFGICPLRAAEMAHDVSNTTLSGTVTFRKNLTSGAWRTLFDYKVRTDVLHAFAGFAVVDETLNLLTLRMELSDRKYPVLDIQEAKGWGAFAIVFKEDKDKPLIAEPETSVYLRGYVEANGWQTIVPLGFQLYKKKDLVITES